MANFYRYMTILDLVEKKMAAAENRRGRRGSEPGTLGGDGGGNLTPRY